MQEEPLHEAPDLRLGRAPQDGIDEGGNACRVEQADLRRRRHIERARPASVGHGNDAARHKCSTVTLNIIHITIIIIDTRVRLFASSKACLPPRPQDS